MIKIDMKMPVSCMECPIKQKHISHNWNYRCVVARAVFNNNISIRHPACPLIEAKNCTFTLWDDYSNTYECSECGLLWNLTEGDPEDNEMKFCPKCGSKIEVKE
ncbi:MAG: hypothetical protein CVU42_17705 [Chloroflexi bacterium HGW-Chloroflexi-4]|jgi:DNA-directed RNA polymerase subunit RPC12/RpoP|nr:MAG: hypothetical protein CVU42_17705 [Chloroflexi bacterium HGW-Chloroflexi-4]